MSKTTTIKSNTKLIITIDVAECLSALAQIILALSCFTSLFL